MKHQLSRSLSLITLNFFILVISSLKFISSYDEHFLNCSQPFNCGVVENLRYPFWGENRAPYCGLPGYELQCLGNDVPIITITSQKYRFLKADAEAHKLIVARDDFWDDLCPSSLVNTSINNSPFEYPFNPVYLTLCYDCPIASMISLGFLGYSVCNESGSFIDVCFKTGVYTPNIGCRSVVNIPILKTLAPELKIDKASVLKALRDGFKLQWKVNDDQCKTCVVSGGQCGNDLHGNKFTCFCPDQPYASECPTPSGKSGTKPAVIIGLSVGGAIVAAALLCCSIFAVRRRRQSLAQDQSKDLGPSNPSNGLPTTATSNEYRYSQGYTTSPSTNLSQSLPSYPSSKSEFENSADYLGVKVFAYNELEEATEHFHESRELGDGGFGTVYYGKLNDGRLVAVKRLYENSCRHMGQFMNEIQILARLRHKNLVALYGCTSRRSRELLLVYEYISNGTVADHLHGKLAQSNVLRWSTRLSIAVETAEALSFLHENEVIHRDVKTTNILLDDSFKVKVADFGLSRLFPDNVTHVSTAPQGTPGYVDPEYYQCYQLTEKSDVYSFGVVLAELISSKVAVDITRHRHDINLANMAVDRIQKHAFTELVDPKLWCEKDHLAQKMVKLVSEVAFQCLQQEKEARPSMKEVLESLKGIQKELDNSQIQVVVDIHENDDVGLLKNVPPPVSPETEPSK